MNQGLHWKIIVGLLLGLVFGIFFPTNYKVTDNTIYQLEKQQLPAEVINILQNEKREFAETETEFLKRIKPSLGPEFFEKYKLIVLAQSKYNAVLWYFSWIGELFLRALKMIIYPLVLISVISGMSNITENDNLGRLAIKTILYFILVSILAIITGLFFVNIIRKFLLKNP
jgi:proton glutamate symport protein